VAALLLTAAAGSLLAAALWALHYQPLESGGGWHAGGRLVGPGVSLHADQEISNVLGTEYLVKEPKPGDAIGLVIPIHNGGRYPIRIAGVEAPFGPYQVTDVRAFRSRDPRTGDEPFEGFRPFTLGPGQTREIAVTARLVTCRSGYRPVIPPAQGSVSTTARGVTVTYSFLGFTNTTVIPLDYALTLRNPPQCAS
jgi:hypothetical protein